MTGPRLVRGISETPAGEFPSPAFFFLLRSAFISASLNSTHALAQVGMTGQVPQRYRTNASCSWAQDKSLLQTEY